MAVFLSALATLFFLLLFPIQGFAGLFTVTEEDEIAIGRQAALQVEEKANLIRDRSIQAYIQRLGERIARRSQRPYLPWRFRVILDPHINAFALPGGYIYIHSKVIETVENEAQLAGVIAHEIGHVEGRHHKQQIERAMRYRFGLGILGALLGQGRSSDYAMIAARMLALGQLTKYSREAELDADRRGVMLMYKAGFDPHEMSRFLAKLAELEHTRQDLLSQFFSDHPAVEERIAKTRELANELPARIWMRSSEDFWRVKRRLTGEVVAPRLRGARIKKQPGGARIPAP